MKNHSAQLLPVLPRIALAFVLAGSSALLTSMAGAQTTGFTYQGRLTDNAVGANGNYDLRFTLYSAVTGGSVVGTALVVNPAIVTNGLFTVSLDFGANFPGADRWLQIEVRPAGSAVAHTVLTPRQKLTSAPYATRAASAATAAAMTGNITASQVVGGTLNISLIGDASITAAKLAVNSVGASQIAAGSVDTGELAGLAVTSDKLANNIGVWNKLGSHINFTAGRVGIGTTIPGLPLEVKGTGGALFRLSGPGGFGTTVALDLSTYDPADFGVATPTSQIRATDTNFSSNIDFLTKNPGAFGNPLVSRLHIDADGRVGVNETAPQGQLDIDTGAGNVTFRNESNLVPGLNVSGTGPYAGYMRFRNVLEVWPNDANTASGRVFVFGTAGNTSIDLNGDNGEVSGNRLTANTSVGQVAVRPDGPVPGMNISGGGLPGILRFRHSLEVWPNEAGTSAGRIDVRNASGSPTITLDGASGDTTVKTLTITGGADIAEPFDLADPSLEPGTVVVIDDTAPGRLVESTRAYDKRVAGIISGAGGISPGLSLHQEGVNSGGKKVALTGRVYVKADATDVSIEPGDLLTTSARTGYAMAVRDSTRCQGAVLGKAMSRLESGTGLVLVLVTLQ